MMEFGRGLVENVWGAGASAVITIVIFTGLPVLHFLHPHTMPLVEVVHEVQRPVYVDMEALLALNESPKPAAIEDGNVTEGVADEKVEVVAETEVETVEEIASNNQGHTGDGEGESDDGVADADVGGAPPMPTAVGISYSTSITRVVAGPRVKLTLKNRPDGASDEQVGAYLAAVKAGAKLGTSSKGRRARCKKTSADVEPMDDGSFEVNRTIVEHYTHSLKNFNSLGWSGPYNENGQRGWKIGGFGCNSPLHFAGLRRGDIVKTVNGKKTNTWLQVFGVYTKLKHHDDFVVAVVRRGELIHLRYRLI